MKYLAQCRTKTFSGDWTQWDTIGDPMTEEEATQFLRDTVTCRMVEFRVLVVPADWPRVFVPRLV